MSWFFRKKFSFFWKPPWLLFFLSFQLISVWLTIWIPPIHSHLTRSRETKENGKKKKKWTHSLPTTVPSHSLFFNPFLLLDSFFSSRLLIFWLFWKSLEKALVIVASTFILLEKQSPQSRVQPPKKTQCRRAFWRRSENEINWIWKKKNGTHFARSRAGRTLGQAAVVFLGRLARAVAAFGGMTAVRRSGGLGDALGRQRGRTGLGRLQTLFATLAAHFNF